MAKLLRISGLVDLLRTDDPKEIRAFAEDKRLDRDFLPGGPLLNRIITRKVRRVLALNGTPLPSVAPHGDAERAKIQAELQTKLDQAAAAGTFDAESVAGIARAVRGYKDAPPLEQAVQQAVGRIFAADYQANAASWAAAELLDKAAHSMNPIASLVWRLSGKITRAQRLLGRMVHDDRAGVHATGIAVHNLVRGFTTMRGMFSYPNSPDPAAGDAVVARCLNAPASVLREAIPISMAGTDSIRPGTLVVLDLARAQQHDDSPEIVFMAKSWSQCPAAAWVPALIRAVWQEALKLPAPPLEPLPSAFRLGFARAQAAHRWTTYRELLGANLLIQLALGVVLLAAPVFVAHLVAVPAAAGFVRLWGALLVLLTALYSAGWFDPIYIRWPNVVGIAGRCVTALLYLLAGRSLLAFAVFDAVFAVLLGWSYVRAVEAELMSRP